MKIYSKLFIFIFSFIPLCSFAINPPRVGVPPILMANATEVSFVTSLFSLYGEGNASYACVYGDFPAYSNIRISLDPCPVATRGSWPTDDQVPHIASVYWNSAEKGGGYFQGSLRYDPKTHHWGSVEKISGTLNLKAVGADVFVLTKD